ncbi:MAG TPA: amino acid adenylation domain-containing protein [Acidobacteriota bacterium]|nr:amino acid adenylation domain-containing protein [Acidobacteriota bacterium]
MSTNPVSPSQALALSSTEKRLWTLRRKFGLQLCGFFACHIGEELDAVRLEEAAREVVARHDILSCRPVESLEGASPAACAFAFQERRAVEPAEDFQDCVSRLLAELQDEAEGGQPEGIRLILEEIEADRFLLAGRIPSLQADAISVLHFLRQLQAAYRSGPAAQEDRLVAQYRDVAAWLNESAQDGLAASAEAFWRRHLAPVPWELELPVDRSAAPESPVFRPAALDWVLPPSVARKAMSSSGEEWLSRQLGAAGCAWLSLMGSRQQVYLGVALSGRPYQELEEAIGPYEKCVPLTARVEAATTFRRLAEELGRDLGELSDWQEWFDLALGDGDDSPASQLPGFPLCLQVRWQPRSSKSGHWRPELLLTASDRYDVKLACSIGDGGVHSQIHYNAALYSRASMRRLGQQINALLALMEDEPQARVLEASALSPSERVDLDALSQGPESPFSGCFHELFERQAGRTPDTVAAADGQRSLSYRCLNQLANRLARQLEQAADVGPEATVALHLGTSIEAQVAILAVLKTGSAFVPLDPQWPAKRTQAVLEESRAVVVLTSEADDLDAGATPRIRIDLERLAEEGSSANPTTRLQPGHLAYVLYTSGTSGRPKGAMITQAGLSNYLSWSASYYGLGPGRKALVHSPLTFDFTLTCLLAPLAAGGTVYPCFSDTPVESLADQLTLLGGASLIKLTPTTVGPLRRLLQVRQAPCRVDCMILGGEALIGNRDLWTLARSLRADVVNEYGPTECVVGSSVYRVGHRQAVQGPLPIGRPLANTRLRLLRPGGEAAETWREAEIFIGGRGLARGYLANPALTAQSFLPDAALGGSRGGRLYRSGDVGRWLGSGQMLYLGRRDSQVKIRGYRIELAEIDLALRSHPDVADCVVTLVERQESHPALAAFVVARQGRRVEPEVVRRSLSSTLPQYMIPGAIHPVRTLPVTRHGKVDLPALQDAVAEAAEAEKPTAAPSSESEKILHGLWQQVLGREQIGIDDNFFQLGGDSILSIQVLARANQQGLRLRPKDMQDHPTIRQLARIASQDADVAAQQPPSREMSGEVPLSPLQRRFFEWDLPEAHHYNQSLLLSLDGRWTQQHFSQALRAVIEHHDALRLYFQKGEDGYRQHCAAAAQAQVLTWVDASSTPDPQRQHLVASKAEEAQRSFDLSRPPLLRVIVFEQGRQDPLLVYLVAHHLVIDHLSWSILLDDLQAALQQARSGESVQLPAKTGSYRSMTEYLEKRAQGDLAQEKEYWLSERWRRAVPLILDHPQGRELNTVENEEHISLTLNRRRSELLRGANAAYGTRTLDLLLTAYAMAYARWSGSQTLALELESHGRHPLPAGPDVSRTVGWFTSLYPILLSLTRPADVERSIKEVKEQLRQVPGNGLGYGLLRYLSPDEDVRRRCAGMEPPDSVFNYLGEVDRAVGPESPFQWLRSSPAANRSPRNPRQHLLEVGIFHSQGRLNVNITYAGKAHRRASVESLAESIVEHLEKIAGHCTGLEAPAFTPSDFPLAGLKQHQIDAILAEHPGVRDIYPLSHTQTGMLFHSLAASQSSPYLVQFCVRLRGKLDREAFGQSWKRVMARHSALRTSFLWEDLSRPLQVVHADPPLPMEELDWRGSVDVQQRLQDLLREQRLQGLDLSRAPLHRLTLVRSAPDTFFFLWTHHHILVDGWSTSNVLREVLAGYRVLSRGEPLARQPARPYREYIEWLLSKSPQEGRSFWQEALEGLSGPTELALPSPPGGDELQAHREAMLELKSEDVEDLLHMASQRRVTPNAVVQAAWALVLGRYAGSDDVTFGITVSGRPPELAEVEERVGLFINTLPMRVRINPATPSADYLAQVSSLLQGVLEHDFLPLVEIQQLANLPEKERLFETILVFENYPMSFDVEALEDELRIDAPRSVEQTNYPLTIVVGAQGRQLSIKAVYHPSRFDSTAVGQILKHLEETLLWMTRSQTDPIGRCAASWSH